jgi:hypothetical protein
MGHYAKVVNGIVKQVIVAEEDFIRNNPSSEGEWIQTSYNTRGNVHTAGGVALRKNFAGVDWIYNDSDDAFHAPQPYNSWTLDKDTYLWNAPVSYPDDGNNYNWNENEQRWDSA